MMAIPHGNHGVLVFLQILPALFVAVSNRFDSIALSVGLGTGLELAFLLPGQGPPSFADELSEFFEVVFLLVG